MPTPNMNTMSVFSAAPHANTLLLLFQVSTLLLAARICGEIARRVNQPAVVGELLAGILLGPSVLGAVFPATLAWVVPQTLLQGHLLEVFGLMGALFLLLITGLETDLRLIKRYFKTGLGVSFGALVLPFLSGLILGQILPADLMGPHAEREVFSLFLATAMSITAIPVIAKVLLDMGLMRREIGQTIIAAAMCDDAIGWILLSIVTGLAAGTGFSALNVLKAVGAVGIFVLFSLTVGKFLVTKTLTVLQRSKASGEMSLSLVLFFTFAWAFFTQALRLEAVFGAFAMGVLFGQIPQLSADVPRRLESITLGFFAPIFFAMAGLKVNVTHLAEPRLLGICAAVILTACGGKIIGAYAGARAIGGRDKWTALSFGAGMNARGAMEIIIASIGLTHGILSQDMFSVIVVMAMITSLMAPIMLRWTLKHVKQSAEEQQRLAEEERTKDSLIAGIRKVLVPVRHAASGTNPVQTLEAQLLNLLGRGQRLAITLFSVATRGQKAGVTAYLESLSPLFPKHDVRVKVVESTHLADTILDEAHRDYDLVMLGAPEEKGGTDILFTPLVDFLVRAAPCPTLVAKVRHVSNHWQPRRILVPTNGSTAAKNAAELAFSLAGQTANVTVLNAVLHGESHWRLENEAAMLRRELGIAMQIVGELKKLGESLGVSTEAESRIGDSPEGVILSYAETTKADLIVLGTNLRPGSERLFLGPRVERILNNAACPVIVINSLN